MTSIFNSYDELIQHASTNQMTISNNTKILLNELRDWYEYFEEQTLEYYNNGEEVCTFSDDLKYKNVIGVETKLDNIDILIEKYEQFLNERNEY